MTLRRCFDCIESIVIYSGAKTWLGEHQPVLVRSWDRRVEHSLPRSFLDPWGHSTERGTVLTRSTIYSRTVKKFKARLISQCSLTLLSGERTCEMRSVLHFWSLGVQCYLGSSTGRLLHAYEQDGSSSSSNSRGRSEGNARQAALRHLSRERKGQSNCWLDIKAPPSRKSCCDQWKCLRGSWMPSLIARHKSFILINGWFMNCRTRPYRGTPPGVIVSRQL